MTPVIARQNSGQIFGLVITLVFWVSFSGMAAAVENQFNGDFQFRGAVVRYAEDSYYEVVGTDTGYDGQAEVRLKDQLFFTDQIYAELHYELLFNSGDTYEKNYRLKQYFSVPSGAVFAGAGPNDQGRLFNLTATIEQADEYYLVHRLDRMLVSFRPQWGDVTIGRQAVTWGNGLVFNPMDLFNPFAPTDTIRDYKVGDDLLSVRFNTAALGEFNVLLVPRRNTDNDIDQDCSSLAGKTHLFLGTTELDLMLARHYQENIIGLGVSGYIGDAAFRSDVVWSTLVDDDDKTGFVNLVLNLDYSWVVRGKNMYGLIEYYHSGLGRDDYPAALLDPEIVTRLGRGELFTLGRDYLAGMIQIELHPLFNLYLSVINNIAAPSGIVQPRAVWSISQQATLEMGGNTDYGKKRTEFGGVPIPGSNVDGAALYTTSPQSLYLLLTWYF